MKIAPILESIRLIGDKLRGNSASIVVIASTLGYKSANNGAFQHKLNDIRKYGLIDGRGKEIKLSELAQKILAPSRGEEAEAMKEMVFKVPLWKDIYDKFGKNPSDFSIALQKITGVNRLEAEAVKGDISKLYIDAVSKISSDGSNTNSDNMLDKALQTDGTKVGLEFNPFDKTDKEFVSFSTEGISLKIIKDKAHLETAQEFIKLFLKDSDNAQDNKTKKKLLSDKPS
jgi:hypothetical protein